VTGEPDNARRQEEGRFEKGRGLEGKFLPAHLQATVIGAARMTNGAQDVSGLRPPVSPPRQGGSNVDRNQTGSKIRCQQ